MGLPLVGKGPRRKTGSPEGAARELERVLERIKRSRRRRLSSLSHQRTSPSAETKGNNDCDTRRALPRARNAGRLLEEAPVHWYGVRTGRRSEVVFHARNLRGLSKEVDRA